MHLDAGVHAIAYVGQKYNYRVVYDLSYPNKGNSDFKKCKSSEFYRDTKKATLFNAPEPRGKEVDSHMFLDSDNDASTALAQ